MLLVRTEGVINLSDFIRIYLMVCSPISVTTSDCSDFEQSIHAITDDNHIFSGNIMPNSAKLNTDEYYKYNENWNFQAYHQLAENIHYVSGTIDMVILGFQIWMDSQASRLGCSKVLLIVKSDKFQALDRIVITKLQLLIAKKVDLEHIIDFDSIVEIIRCESEESFDPIKKVSKDFADENYSETIQNLVPVSSLKSLPIVYQLALDELHLSERREHHLESDECKVEEI